MFRKFMLKLSLKAHFDPTPNLINTKSFGMLSLHNASWYNVFAKTEYVLPKFYYWYFYRQIKAGDLVWVKLTSRYKKGKTANLERFVKYVLPKINQPFSLVTTDGDSTVPDELPVSLVHGLISNKYLTFWYSQNCTNDGMSSNKFKPIPIGFDFHTNRCGLIGNQLASALSAIALDNESEDKRLNKIFTDTLINKTSPVRSALYKQIKDCEIYEIPREPLPQLELWRTYKNYSFVLSLEGNGIDCHRTWEALYMGCTVVVISSPLDHLYKNLNVYIVNSVDDLSSPILFDKLVDFRASFNNWQYQRRFFDIDFHLGRK